MRRSLGDLEIDKELEEEQVDAIPTTLDFAFDFVELCGGIGSVSKAIEISDSPHYDIRTLKVIELIFFLLRRGRLRSIMVELVCTTFSAAAHPMIRSYREPKGFNRSCPKVIQGNVIAFRCLFLLWYARLCLCPGLGEQPRLSKMLRLSIWEFLLGHKNFSEAVVASCKFGSPHKKEFRLIGWGLDMDAIDTRCPGGHSHLRIEGRYTKPSAMYTPALAEHLGAAFAEPSESSRPSTTTKQRWQARARGRQ